MSDCSGSSMSDQEKKYSQIKTPPAHPFMSKKKPQSTTARTRKLYEESGYTAWKTEYWCGFSHKRKDLFGFMDILAFNDTQTIGVQDTSWANTSARKNKILASPIAYDWLLSTCRQIHVVGWKAPDKSVGRHRWTHKIIIIAPADFKEGRPDAK